jgi:hypothetical protein
MSDLSDALSGHGKLQELQRVLRSGRPREALRDLLKALLPVPAMLGPCRLKRAKFKPGRKLTNYYDAVVRMGGGDGYCVRPIAVTWRCDGEAAPLRENDGADEMQAEALHRGVAAPFRQLTASLPKWNMHLAVSPLDADFVQLVRLLDEQYVSQMLATAYAAAGTVSACRGYKVTSIRYRPGQRHVLRYDPVDGAKEAVFAKLCRDQEEGRRVFQVTTEAGEWLRQHRDGITAVQPLAHAIKDNVVLYRGLCGMPLSNRLQHTSIAVASFLQGSGVGLRALHQLPQAVIGQLDVHDFAGETGKVARASAYIGALLPDLGAVINVLLDRMSELYPQLPQEPPTFTHGDFKAEHVWVTPRGLSLIDFDSCHVGDPALDSWKFLAHLRLWYDTCGRPGELEWAQKSFLAGYDRGIPKERLVRARLYEALELIKLTARRIPLFAFDWEPRAERLVGQAQVLMNQLELMLGLPATQTFFPGPRRQKQILCGGNHQFSLKGARC